MAAQTYPIDVNGAPLTLSAQRVAFDPVNRALLVADVHLGKDAVFRARGIPVPTGATADTFARLDAVIAQFAPQSLYFLGDLLHARESHAPEVLDGLSRWRAAHRGLRLVLVEGNHDRHAGALADEFGIETVFEPYRLGPWALCHHPQPHADGYVLAGHEHPVYTLRTGVDRVRLSCFRFGARVGVLPAFGALTGGYEATGERGPESVYVVAANRIFSVRR